ncbi:MAG: methionine synthase [Methanotrichaceae archaeon]
MTPEPPIRDIRFDEIGSYPLPKGVRREDISLDEPYLDMVEDALLQKISAGVEIPNYPQFRDMIRMFMDPIEDPDKSEVPYLIDKEAARIFELEALERAGTRMMEEGRRLQARVCVTGPVELYQAAFGLTDYSDLLFNMAESVARFLKGALASRSFDVAVVSVDEPSLGISSNIIFEEDDIQTALEMATRPCNGVDCEVHLHSPLFVELCCRVPGINVIGVESAANPDYLRLIDLEMLEEHETYIRAGIARTDIHRLVSTLNDRLETNLWTEPERLEREVHGAESPDLMEQRLAEAYRIFGQRIKYAGPDCGLGSWPSQEMASRHLANCARAIKSFRGK